jgi:hypothetical protein
MNQASRSTEKQCSVAVVLLGVLLGVPLGAARGGQTTADTLERPGGERVQGRITGDARAGFGFQATGAGEARLGLERGALVEFSSTGPQSLTSPPPYRVLIGDLLRLSGTLKSITRGEVRFGVAWQADSVTVRRPGVQAVVQRPGEARVLVDGFEELDLARWSIAGKPVLVDEPHMSDRRSLRLPAGGASLFHRLEEPLGTGRFDLAFFDDGAVAAGRQWSIELTFHGPSGPSVVRVVLGWSEESLAVESPDGPALQIQRLARTPRWHRFSLRFSPEQTELSVDAKELAHGKGPDGPLTAIRLASQSQPLAAPPSALSGHVDDLQLIRFAEPPASLELDVTQDEARLVVGDQLYGEIGDADGERVRMTVDGEPATLLWRDVAGLYFRRVPAQGAPVAGLLVRVEWRASPGDNPDDLDFAEGALLAVSETTLTLATPYSGTLSIPRDRLRKLIVRGQGLRVVIDPAAHHLGDEISVAAPILDPPEPEGGLLERSIDLAAVPDRPAALVLDVIGVVSETSDPGFSQRVREGEYRTYAVVNGKRIDYLNHHIKDDNKTPERITIPIPDGCLHPGKNSVRLELDPSADRKQLDDLGVLQITLEFGTITPHAAHPQEPGPP